MGAPPLAFRQGVVVTWDQTTGENTVNVGGTVVANLPVLTTSEVTSLAAGDVVGLLRSGPQFFVLGRIDLASAGGGAINIGAAGAARGLLGYNFSSSALPSAGTTSTTYATTTLEKSVTPEANRLIKVSLFTAVTSTVAADRVSVGIRDITQKELPSGYAGPLSIPSGVWGTEGYVVLQERGATVSAGPRSTVCTVVAYDDRGLAGARTYQAVIARTSGTGTCKIDADATSPTLLFVEDVGPLT
jgi:hypothetical protein